MREGQGEGAAALGDGTQGGGEIEHFAHRDLCLDLLQAVLGGVHAQHTATALGKLGVDIAHVGGGNLNLQGADGLEDDGVGLGQTGLISQRSGGLERHFVGIYGVIGAIDQDRLEADDGITGDHAAGNAVLQALFNGREEVLGDGAADDLLLEDEGVAVAGLKLDPNITVLAVAAGLLLVLALNTDLLADGLTVGNTGLHQTHIDAELGLELGNDDVQMLFAQAGDDLLLGLDVILEADAGVLLDQALHGTGDLGLIALALQHNGHREAGSLELGGLEGDDALGIAKGIAGHGIGKLGHGADITGTDGINLILLFAAAAQQLAQTLRLAGSGIYGGHAGGQLAGDDLDEGQLADEGVGNGLKDESGLGGIGIALDGLTLDGLLTAAVGGTGQEVNDGIHEDLAAGAGGGAAAEYGSDGAALYAGGDALLDLLLGEGLLHEELLHELIVGLGHGFIQRHLHLLDAVGSGGGDGNLIELIGLGVELIGLIIHQVDVAIDGIALHVGDDDGADGIAEHFLDALEGLIEIGVLHIQLIDEECLGFIHAGGQTVGLFGADAHAVLGGNDQKHRLGGTDALRNAGGEIEHTGGIQQVDLYAVPIEGRNGGADRYLTLDLLGIEVAYGIAVGDFAQTVGGAGFEQQHLCQAGFAGAAVTC